MTQATLTARTRSGIVVPDAYTVSDHTGTVLGCTAPTATGRTVTAYRNNAQDGVDIRRVSHGFRTVQAAAAWIARGAA